eukprot:236847_1
MRVLSPPTVTPDIIPYVSKDVPKSLKSSQICKKLISHTDLSSLISPDVSPKFDMSRNPASLTVTDGELANPESYSTDSSRRSSLTPTPMRQLMKSMKISFNCAQCTRKISGASVILNGASYHDTCVTCSQCHMPLGSEIVTPPSGELFCTSCFEERSKSVCGVCDEAITGPYYNTMGKKIHAKCLVCAEPGCGQISKDFRTVQGTLYCGTHYLANFVCQCKICCLRLLKTQSHIKCGSYAVHTQCWKCEHCFSPLGMGSTDVNNWRERILCGSCNNLPEETLYQTFFPGQSSPSHVSVTEPIFDFIRIDGSENHIEIGILIDPRAGVLAEFASARSSLEALEVFRELGLSERRATLQSTVVACLEEVEAFRELPEDQKLEILDTFMPKFNDFLDGLSPRAYERILAIHAMDDSTDSTQSSVYVMPMDTSQAFLKRCIEDSSLLGQFDTLPSTAKEVILDRFLEQNHGSLTSFKSLAVPEQHSIMAELLKHNVDRIEGFHELGDAKKKQFMRLFAEENIKYLNNLDEVQYQNLCTAAMKKYTSFRPVIRPSEVSPSNRPTSTGGPYTFEELRHRDFLPKDVPVERRELMLVDSEFEKYFGMSKREFYTLKLWRQRALKMHVGLF